MLQTENDIVDEILVTILKIVNAADHFFQELNLVILVSLLDVPLEADLILGELRYHLLVSSSHNPGKGVVVLGGYCGGPSAQVNHSNLSKVIALSKKWSDFLVLAIGVTDSDLAVTLSNEVHASLHVVIFEIILLDDLLVRDARHSSQLVNQARE